MSSMVLPQGLPRALPHIQAIAPYPPGKPISELAREFGLAETEIIKLASNENPLGISPKAQAAITMAISDLALYPDGNGYRLKKALSDRLGIEPNQIVLGNGSNDVLELVARCFLEPGRSAVISQHAFAVYPLAIQACNATVIEVPAHGFGHDLEGMRAAIRPDTAMLFIANPNNPTGTRLSNADLETFLSSVPERVVVVLDEAYTEFLDTASDALAWLKKHPNLIVTRTFSKAYGLAGLRVGYALAAPEFADWMNRVRQPFNVNSLALAAAEAVLDDSDFLARSKQVNDAGMAQLTQGFARLGLEWIPSAGNFVCCKVAPQSGVAVFQALLAKGVIVRPVANYGLPEWLRVSVGLPEQNARFLLALAEVLR